MREEEVGYYRDVPSYITLANHSRGQAATTPPPLVFNPMVWERIMEPVGGMIRVLETSPGT